MQMPDRRTYVQPVPRRLRMRSITETATAPKEQRTRLFYEWQLRRTCRQGESMNTYTCCDRGAMLRGEIDDEGLRAVHHRNARPANCKPR